MKNSNDIGNRTRDLVTCSTVPQRTASPRTFPVRWVPAHSRGVKQLGRGVIHEPLLAPRCTSAPSLCLHGILQSELFLSYYPPLGLCIKQKLLIIIFNLRTAAFKAYCAIWIRCSKFRHQASPRVSPRESTQRRKLELWARNIRKFCLNVDFHVTFRDLLHAVKLRHWTDGFTSPPKEGVLRIFLDLKIRLLRPGENPRTWVPEAGALPLDHRSRLANM
jgi:hypothetical protein